MDYKNDNFLEYLERRQKQKEHLSKTIPIKLLRNLAVGLLLGGAAVFLAVSPDSIAKTSYSSEQRNVASFLAGMFGFASIDVLRRSVDN